MPGRTRIMVFSAALILGFTFFSTAWAARIPDLGSQLALQSAPITDSRLVYVTVTVTNRSATPQTFLRRGTPFAGLADHPAFVVERDGEPLTYYGLYVHYLPPTAENFITLAPGESRSATVNLGEIYDLSFPGEYRVQLRLPMRGVSGRAADMDGRARGAWSGRLASAVVDFTIHSSAVRTFEPFRAPDALQGPGVTPNSGNDTFTGCNLAEKVQVQEALAKACEEAAVAQSVAGAVALGSFSANWTEWYGAQDAARAAVVNAGWGAIHDAICTSASSKKMEYVCHGPDCEAGWYAYVQPAVAPNTINLCNGFWNSGAVGYDTRAGTLIHEMSHLKAGTDDNAYGVDDCRDLAVNDPWSAVYNADTYEYFAEDLNQKIKGTPGLTPVQVSALAGLLLAGGAAVLRRRVARAA